MRNPFTEAAHLLGMPITWSRDGLFVTFIFAILAETYDGSEWHYTDSISEALYRLRAYRDQHPRIVDIIMQLHGGRAEFQEVRTYALPQG